MSLKIERYMNTNKKNQGFGKTYGRVKHNKKVLSTTVVISSWPTSGVRAIPAMPVTSGFPSTLRMASQLCAGAMRFRSDKKVSKQTAWATAF